jgi:nitrite reductase (NADH) small subunit/3-phenylpropionate/trans-cinnamate dioxygenase ferredoxin subunit
MSLYNPATFIAVEQTSRLLYRNKRVVLASVPNFKTSPPMSEFHTVAKVGDIPEGEGRAFQVAGRMVAVFQMNGKFTAINDTCPHMGASLATGYVEGGGVTCPWHAWRFGICDGLWLDNPKASIRQDVYEVRVDGDDVQVSIS